MERSSAVLAVACALAPRITLTTLVAPMTLVTLATLATMPGNAHAAELPGPLPDQFGAEIMAPAERNQPLLVIVTQARKARHIERWEQALRKTQPELLSIRVADLTGNPKPGIKQVSQKLRQQAPEEVSILIDKDNLWAQTYDLDTREPCLLIFDPQNNLTARFRGRANKKNVAAVIEAMTAPQSTAASSANSDP
ncbi:MAG: hypothetical protein OEU86_05880 [Gammaproteobacteria bacterium]|nr:hypothetical protein [Gammaproteobacteria bacterium]